MTVIQFRARHIRQENGEVRAEIAAKANKELSAEDLRLIRMVAWEKFLLATKAMVAAQDAMNDAHRVWLDADIQYFATNVAEQL